MHAHINLIREAMILERVKLDLNICMLRVIEMQSAIRCFNTGSMSVRQWIMVLHVFSYVSFFHHKIKVNIKII